MTGSPTGDELSSAPCPPQARELGTNLDLPAPARITIAVTVFERTDYIIGAIESALQQTVPVRVIVVEDCAATSRVRDLVVPHFGDRITYLRNPVRRGIFGNWNACCDYVETEWISILHDDDLLTPTFIAEMIRLGEAAGPMGAYFCHPNILWPNGTTTEYTDPTFSGPWRGLDLQALAVQNALSFPGQLLHVPSVVELGGFHEASQFAGDWDMWFKLAFYHGAAQTRAAAALARSHEGAERGTTRVIRSGRKLALDFVQARRNFSILRQRLPNARFDRREALRLSPIALRELAAIFGGLSKRMARYQWGLLQLSTPPNFPYRLVQWITGLLGPSLLAKALRGWRQSVGKRSQA